MINVAGDYITNVANKSVKTACAQITILGDYVMAFSVQHAVGIVGNGVGDALKFFFPARHAIQEITPLER